MIYNEPDGDRTLVSTAFIKLISRRAHATGTHRLFITEPFQIVHEFIPSAAKNIEWCDRKFDPAVIGQEVHFRNATA